MPIKPHKTPTILVTDAMRGCAVTIIRSLGRRGWRVIASDSSPRAAGLFSRFASEKLVYPSPVSAPDEFITTMIDAVRSKGVDLIFPVTDNTILPLSDERDQFDGLCQLAIPPADKMEITNNKLKTFEMAERLGVPFPKTQLVSSVDEALERSSSMSWPIVLKPQLSHVYRSGDSVERLSVAYAENQDDLAKQMKFFEPRCPVLLQEYFQGVGHGIELLMKDGQPLFAFQHQRLREVPISGGASSLRQSVPLDRELFDYSVGLLGELNWTGLAMVEFKVGDDGAKLMEINGRVWGSLPLAVFSEMDFPARLVDLLLFDKSDAEEVPGTSYRVGVRAHSFQKELSWIAEVLIGRHAYPFLPMPPRYQAVGAIAELFHPRYKYDVLSLNDMRPGLAQIRNILMNCTKVLKPLRSRSRVTQPNPAPATLSGRDGRLTS